MYRGYTVISLTNALIMSLCRYSSRSMIVAGGEDDREALDRGMTGPALMCIFFGSVVLVALVLSLALMIHINVICVWLLLEVILIRTFGQIYEIACSKARAKPLKMAKKSLKRLVSKFRYLTMGIPQPQVPNGYFVAAEKLAIYNFRLQIESFRVLWRRGVFTSRGQRMTLLKEYLFDACVHTIRDLVADLVLQPHGRHPVLARYLPRQ